MKVVLDTNVFLSAVFFGGIPGRVLQAWRDRRLDFVLSVPIFNEYQQAGERLAARFGGMDIGGLLILLAASCEFVDPVPLEMEPVCHVLWQSGTDGAADLTENGFSGHGPSRAGVSALGECRSTSVLPRATALEAPSKVLPRLAGAAEERAAQRSRRPPLNASVRRTGARATERVDKYTYWCRLVGRSVATSKGSSAISAGV